MIMIAAILIATVAAVARYVMKKNYMSLDEDIVLDSYDIRNLTVNIRQAIQNSLRQRVEDMNLNKYETEKLKKNKSRLRKAVRDAPTGDMGAKDYVKDYILNLLQTKLGVDETTIDKIIRFDEPEKLSPQDRFEIVLHLYRKEHGLKAFCVMLEENGLDRMREDMTFDVAEQDIRLLYRKRARALKYRDKLAIVCQRIYQNYIGHGVIDELRDMRIDGISIGVSGITEQMFEYAEENCAADCDKVKFSFGSVWVYHQGKSIHMSCIGFGSQEEFERVCKNIYKYNNPGQLSESRGYIGNELKDGSRIIVFRPPMSDSWGAILRKHQNGRVISVDAFVTDAGKEIPVSIIRYIVKGCRVIAFTGHQGCGKTTVLRGAIEWLPRTFNLRIQEMIFELGLRSVFGKRNIVTFKETDNVSGQEGLDIQKKTDGDVNILGEVATSPVANWIIQISQVASLMTMFTHHAKTTHALIAWMRDALLKDGGLTNESVAEEEVVQCLNFDVHLAIVRKKENYGHRYIKSITEIVPLPESGREHPYELNEIMAFDEGAGRYILKNRFTKRTEEEIFAYLEEDEIEELNRFFETHLEGVA